MSFINMGLEWNKVNLSRSSNNRFYAEVLYGARWNPNATMGVQYGTINSDILPFSKKCIIEKMSVIQTSYAVIGTIFTRLSNYTTPLLPMPLLRGSFSIYTKDRDVAPFLNYEFNEFLSHSIEPSAEYESITETDVLKIYGMVKLNTDNYAGSHVPVSVEEVQGYTNPQALFNDINTITVYDVIFETYLKVCLSGYVL